MPRKALVLNPAIAFRDRVIGVMDLNMEARELNGSGVVLLETLRRAVEAVEREIRGRRELGRSIVCVDTAYTGEAGMVEWAGRTGWTGTGEQ